MTYTLWHLAKDVVTGKVKLASREVTKSRLATCSGCEAKNNKLNTCTACGCYLPAKARLADADCPMELWNDRKQVAE